MSTTNAACAVFLGTASIPLCKTGVRRFAPVVKKAVLIKYRKAGVTGDRGLNLCGVLAMKGQTSRRQNRLQADIMKYNVSFSIFHFIE